jgi:hypothetical protein
MDAERVKPLTMSAEAERDYRSYTGRENARFVVDRAWAELDATRSQLAALTESHAACVRALREVVGNGCLASSTEWLRRKNLEVCANALSDPLSLAVEDK